eukprot:Colp12_sorted_trinity150504_noHs@1930
MEAIGTNIYLPTVASLAYVGLVAYGKANMKGPATYRLPSSVMRFYNGFQIFYNLLTVFYIVGAITYELAPLAFFGNAPNFWDKNVWLPTAIFLHYMSKYLDIIDTVIIVIHKKEDQLSFLHYYHHLSIIWCWWAVLIWREPDAYLGALLNSVVHAVMYGYYLLTSYKIAVPTFIKKNITTMQQIQFLAVSSQSIMVFKYADAARHLAAAVQLWEMLSLFVLFSFWRMKRYAGGAKKAAPKKE